MASRHYFHDKGGVKGSLRQHAAPRCSIANAASGLRVPKYLPTYIAWRYSLFILGRMTISRPLSLPVIHPPSVTVATMPCQERWQYPVTDACSETPPRPRNASLDVPLLQRTFATLQEQIGLMTPPDSDHGGGGTGSKTAPSAKSPQTINVLESRNTELVDEMFGLLVSRIGQRVIPGEIFA